MDAKNVIAEIRKAVIGQKGQGQQVIDADALIKYLDAFEQDASESMDVPLAQFRAQHESGLAQWRAQFEADQEAVRATIQAGHSAIRAAILINGAAAAALLAFVGSVWAGDGATKPNLSHFPIAMLTFVFGVFGATIAIGTNYLAAFAASSKSSRMFYLLNSVTIFFVIASYVTFIVGGIFAFYSFIAD